MNYHRIQPVASGFKDSRGQAIKGELFLHTSRILESSTPRTLVAQKIKLMSSPKGKGFSPKPEWHNSAADIEDFSVTPFLRNDTIFCRLEYMTPEKTNHSNHCQIPIKPPYIPKPSLDDSVHFCIVNIPLDVYQSVPEPCHLDQSR